MSPDAAEPHWGISSWFNLLLVLCQGIPEAFKQAVFGRCSQSSCGKHNHFFLSRKAPSPLQRDALTGRGCPSSSGLQHPHKQARRISTARSSHCAPLPFLLHYITGTIKVFHSAHRRVFSSFQADLGVKSLFGSSSLAKLSRRALSLFAVCIFLLHLAEPGSG